MQIILGGSILSSNGMWLTSVPPHQLGMLGTPRSSLGTTSILLVTHPSFDQEKGQLVLDAEAVTVLNLGTTVRTVVVDTEAEDARAIFEATEPDHLGPGDREFLSMVERELKGEAQEAAVDLLRTIRQTDAGDLKRGEPNNFSNTPDNFWYVIVQPRAQSLSVTVRGLPASFSPSSLQLVTDRPGYTRFHLRSVAELPEALRIISQSKRKGWRRF
jgi:hypothetical protein